MSKMRGLPPQKKMRHDSHFVEELTAEAPSAVGRMIPIDRVQPNPHQPRKHFGDLSEMVASVKEKGILEPILVRQHEGNYQIIAGERRYQAARLAGLQQVPCIEVDVDNRGMLEISLIENLQRKDLTPFEEAAALQRLSDEFRYTHEEIARKLGKSRTAVTETLSLNRMPEEIQDRCRRADITSKSVLLEIVRQSSVQEMHRLVDRITGEGLTRDEVRQVARDEPGRQRRPRRFVFRFEPEDEEVGLRLTFRKEKVAKAELIEALHRLLQRLMSELSDEDLESAGGGNGDHGRDRVAGPPGP